MKENDIIPIEEFYEKVLKNDKAVAKHLLQHHWISGTSSVVYPVMTDMVGYEIELQWDSDNVNTARGLMKRMEKHENVKCVHFWKSDGSCPSMVMIRFQRP